MGVAFAPGQVLGRGDLDIFLTNSVGNATKPPSSTTFAACSIRSRSPWRPSILITSAVMKATIHESSVFRKERAVMIDGPWNGR